MKRLFRDQIPADKAKELKGVRFVKMSDDAFDREILAKGDDPNMVNDAAKNGMLYRIDEREK